MIIKQIKLGQMKNFTYLIGCDITKEAVVIDPNSGVNKIVDIAKSYSFKIKYIFNTHYHADHTNGNAGLKKLTDAKILIHKLDAKSVRQIINLIKIGTCNFSLSPCADIIIDKEAVFNVGNIIFELIHTPGHSPRGICFYTKGNLFTGDTLFVGDSGRTDLTGGDRSALGASLRKLMLQFPDETIVWPGHDYGQTPTSTIEWEKQNNINAREYRLNE